jgi:transposase-like protein
MNHARIIEQYAKGRTIAKLARKYEVNQPVIREIVRAYQLELKEYQKEVARIRQELPHHDDRKADLIWEAALGMENFN